VSYLENLAVGYDGSGDSLIALRWALNVAKVSHATVTVVHATGMLERLETRFSSDVLPTEIVALAEECGFNSSALRWIVAEGDACSVLLRTCDPPINADVIVVGSRGQGKRVGLLLGSTSLEVSEHATIPVVVVPSGYKKPR
jgi:nucleotide-binding universal stress UspA family protein